MLIASSAEKCSFLKQLLKARGYSVLEAFNGETGIQKAIENMPDLIICQNEMQEGYSGFQIYNQLKNILIKNGTPFFIYSDEFDQEDILIGLEMGIDNFIILPVDESVIIHKIEHQIRKIRELKLFEIDKFKAHFDATPVAKFVMERDKMEMANKAFRKLMQFSDSEILPSFEKIFDIAGNKKNILSFRKCINGFIQQCNLEEVPCNIQNGNCFDIHLYYTDSDLYGKVYAEVIPSGIKRDLDFAPDMSNVYKIIPGTMNFSSRNDFGGMKFTPREKEILELSSKGLAIKQIAAKLMISERTIEKHRANIMRKTKTSSIIEAIFIIRNHCSAFGNVMNLPAASRPGIMMD